MVGRAVLYEALAAGDADALRAARPKLAVDPLLLYLQAWYLRYLYQDVAGAERAAEEAVRITAGLDHTSRDILAAVRIAQNRPRDALVLLDPLRTLPVRRNATSGTHRLLGAQANMLLGRERDARHDLEQALVADRWIIPDAKADPALAGFTDVFARIEEDFLDGLFEDE
jgi:hypothetical protein